MWECVCSSPLHVAVLTCLAAFFYAKNTFYCIKLIVFYAISFADWKKVVFLHSKEPTKTNRRTHEEGIKNAFAPQGDSLQYFFSKVLAGIPRRLCLLRSLAGCAGGVVNGRG